MASSSIISPLEQHNDVYRTVKPTVWILKVNGTTKKKKLEVTRHGTAFAVNNCGVLISCVHILHGLRISDIDIEARRLDRDGLTSKASAVDLRNRRGLCLLRVGVDDCEFSNLATDESLQEGETLLCISNPVGCIGSFGISHVLFHCVENVDLPTGFRTCSRYDPSSSMEKTPDYRVMGHVWNKVTLARKLKDGLINSDDYYWNLHPLIPIIQCGDTLTGKGCVGGPVFTVRGEVVGILASHNRPDQIAIHVSLIREYLKGNKINSSVG